MRDRHVLETLLIHRFPGAPRDQVAAAANAIMALVKQWDAPDPPRPPIKDGDGCVCESPAVCSR